MYPIFRYSELQQCHPAVFLCVHLSAITYPLFASMISSFEIQNELLPHCLISAKREYIIIKQHKMLPRNFSCDASHQYLLIKVSISELCATESKGNRILHRSRTLDMAWVPISMQSLFLGLFYFPQGGKSLITWNKHKQH